MADSKESAFQQDIIDSLATQGWQVGQSSNYNRTNALYTDDLLTSSKPPGPIAGKNSAKITPKTPQAS